MRPVVLTFGDILAALFDEKCVDKIPYLRDMSYEDKVRKVI